MARAHSIDTLDPFDVAVDRYERRERARERVRLVAALQTGVGALGVGLGGFLFLVIAPWGLLTGDPGLTMLLGGIGTVIAAFFTLLSLPGLLAGVGMLRGHRWARTLGVVVALLQLFHVPVGTLLGGATLFVLLQEDVRDHFERGF